MKLPRHKRISATKLIERLENEFPYLLRWAENYVKDSGFGYMHEVNHQRTIRVIIIHLIVQKSPIYNDELFHLMKTKRGKWNVLYRNTYDWIVDNEELIQLRML